jgi:hypothetical protein
MPQKFCESGSCGFEGASVVGPAERFRGAVVDGDERGDLVCEILSRGELAAKRLLDLPKQQGFGFERVGLSQDAPLRGKRETLEWIDDIVVVGFSDSCEATQRRRYSLIVLGGMPVTVRVTGDALMVLHTVTFDWAAT